MASQVTHIVYAKKYLEKYPSAEIKKDLFLLGSVFPDIRYIDKSIKRSDTHLKFSPIDLNFSGHDSFQAGWKFHLYSDMKREEILRNVGIYGLFPKDVSWDRALKMAEDELLYEKFNNWGKITAFFNDPPLTFLPEFVPKESYYLWYAVLSKYMSEKPNEKSMHVFLSKLILPIEKTNDVIEKISKIKQNERAMDLLGGVYELIV